MRVLELFLVVERGPQQENDDGDEEPARQVSPRHVLLGELGHQALHAARRLLGRRQRAVGARQVRRAEVPERREVLRGFDEDVAQRRARVVRRGQRIVAGGADGGAEDGGRLRLPRAHLRPGLRVGLHVDGVVRAQVVVGGGVREGLDPAADEQREHEVEEKLDRLEVQRQALGVLPDGGVGDFQGKRSTRARDDDVPASGSMRVSAGQRSGFRRDGSNGADPAPSSASASNS